MTGGLDSWGKVNLAVLSKHECPRCRGSLRMIAEGSCLCHSCGFRFDPTIAFQRCAACSGKPRLRIRRYECASCGDRLVSRFLFDGLVFDVEYFRGKMAEHRQRIAERRERVRRMLAERRSGWVRPSPANLSDQPDLVAALDALSVGVDPVVTYQPKAGFDLNRYQAHVQAHISASPITLDEVPPLGKDPKIDRIWRFIAIIFLAHAGIIDVWQKGEVIIVKQRDTDRERQGVSGNAETADAIQGFLGRIEV